MEFDVATLPFSPTGRKWPEGSDEGVRHGKTFLFASGIPLIRLPAPSPRGGEGR